MPEGRSDVESAAAQIGYAVVSWQIGSQERTVAELQVGQKVSVNLVGLHVAEVEFGGSTSATGIVEDIDPTTKEITVRLNISFSGRQYLIVSPARVAAS